MKSPKAITSEKLLCWSEDVIKKPLCKLPSSNLSLDAVQMFKNLSSFMGDRASSKAPIEHVIKLLNQLLNAPVELQDEFYCQISKQTHQNPSALSTEKGWQMMLMCLATFPPSEQLLPCLMAYCVRNLGSTVPNVHNYVSLVLHRAKKSRTLNSRKSIPTMMEIEAIKRGGCVTLKVYFCDKKYVYCRVDSWTTFTDLRGLVCEAMYIHRENEEFFTFYEVNEINNSDRIPHPEDRVLEMLSRWELSSTLTIPDKKTGNFIILAFKI